MISFRHSLGHLREARRLVCTHDIEKLFAANVFTQAANITCQVLALPAYLKLTSAAEYGEWLILTSALGYISLLDLGLNSGAANAIAIEAERGHLEAARSINVTALYSVATVVLGFGLIVLGAMKYAFNVRDLLHLHLLRSAPVELIVALQAGACGLSLLQGCFYGQYRVNRQAHTFQARVALIRTGELAVSVGSFAVWRSWLGSSVALVAYKCATTALLAGESRRFAVKFPFSPGLFSVERLRELAAPALGFMCFPLGYFLSFQGLATIVGIRFGPTVLVVFTAVRTYARVAMQLPGMIRNSFGPAISRAFGRRDGSEVRGLLRVCLLATVGASTLAAVGQIAFFRPVFALWTAHRIHPAIGQVAVMVLAAWLQNAWLATSVVNIAINAPSRIAAVFVASNCAVIAVCVTWHGPGGIEFVASLMAWAEIVTLGFCLYFVHRLLQGMQLHAAP